jgi:hypothetical protein
MYKVGYMTYHISQCGTFDALLKVLKDGKGLTQELDYEACCKQIGRAVNHNKAQYCTRRDGFRSKVCELIMTNNYGEDFPGDILKYV